LETDAVTRPRVGLFDTLGGDNRLVAVDVDVILDFVADVPVPSKTVSDPPAPSVAVAPVSMRRCSGRNTAVTSAPGESPAVSVERIVVDPQSTVATPSSTAETVPLNRFAVPTKSATNGEAGSEYTASGGPTCANSPSFITTTRSDIVSASFWLCVTSSVVMPSCC
jgi:hypothetical protein